MSYPLLDSIHSKEDFLRIPPERLNELAAELRERMVEVTLNNGGHLASSLGSVELIIAMERVFAYDTDRLVFDVGHQAYAHKLLTGRNVRFDTLRKEDGISGFPKRAESAYDSFDTGHASTSISAALGMARAMKHNGTKGCAVALIGDGALTGGLAWEAMNDAGSSKIPMIIVLNDNGMSISRSVGAMRSFLMDARTSRGYLNMKRQVSDSLHTGRFGRWLSGRMVSARDRIKRFLLPNLLFEDLGFKYLGPIDGHNIEDIVHVLKRARATDSPVIIHAITKKGYGYSPAMDNPEKYHGISPAADNAQGRPTCSEVFGNKLVSLAESDLSIMAITAAMRHGTGLDTFAERYRNRFFDVGIAEEHAVTMAAGMACEGLRPVVAIYSTFLQRAYDQILHDVCLQKLPVVFAVDRAGLVGEDGETHQGIYDVSFLSDMPGLIQYAPSCSKELNEMLEMAIHRNEPASIRYSRGVSDVRDDALPVQFGKWEEICPIARVNLITYGSLIPVAIRVARACGCGLINARFPVQPDESVIRKLKECAHGVLVAEDGIECLGKMIRNSLCDKSVKTVFVANEPVHVGTVEQQRKRYGLDEASLKQAILSLMEEV